MEEQWRPVVGYETLYSVSDYGRVRRDLDGESRPSGQVLRYGHVRGYAMVSLSKAGFSKRYMVHRLVMAAFVGPVPDGMQVNHKNRVRGDNRLSNLEFLTPSANMKHAYAAGRVPLRGESNGMSLLSDSQAIEARRLFAEGMSQAAIGRSFGVHKTVIHYIVRRKTFSHLP